MKTNFLLFSILILSCFYSCQNEKSKAEALLERSQEMLDNLPLNEDIYGLKKVFQFTAIIPASFKNGAWGMHLKENKKYVFVFILPETKEDYKKSGLSQRGIMFTGSDPNSQIPFFVIINPRFLNEVKKKGVDFDYLASCFLHESVHIYQRTVLLRKGLLISNSIKDDIEREKEAYFFQGKFISQILFRNGIDGNIKIPQISNKDQKSMSQKNLEDFCIGVDKANDNKLGFWLSSLIVCDTYPDMYLNFVNYNYLIEN